MAGLHVGRGAPTEALRISGWALTLAGLAYAGVWAVAPVAVAAVAGPAVVATGLVITVVYTCRTLAVCRQQQG